MTEALHLYEEWVWIEGTELHWVKFGVKHSQQGTLTKLGKTKLGKMFNTRMGDLVGIISGDESHVRYVDKNGDAREIECSVEFVRMVATHVAYMNGPIPAFFLGNTKAMAVVMPMTLNR